MLLAATKLLGYLGSSEALGGLTSGLFKRAVARRMLNIADDGRGTDAGGVDDVLAFFGLMDQVPV